MSEQSFKVAGITTHGMSTKVRFTEDLVRRVKQFTKGGASRIDLVELPNEMTKIEALKYLATHSSFQSAEDQATIADAISDRTKESKKAVVKVKGTKPSLEAIKARAKTKEVTVQDILATVGTAPF